MQIQAADYVLAGIVVVLALLGLFRGFSGAFAFLVASAATAALSVYGWPAMPHISQTMWVRAAVMVVADILLFGLVRIAVKKVVNGLLAQPVDAIAGCIVGLVCGAMVVLAASYFPFVRERSAVAREVSVHVW